MTTIICWKNQDGFHIFLQPCHGKAFSLSSNTYDFVSGDQSRQSFRNSSPQHSPNMCSYLRLPKLRGMWLSLWSVANMMNLELQVFCLLCFVEWMPCFTRASRDAKRCWKVFSMMSSELVGFFFFLLPLVYKALPSVSANIFLSLVLLAAGC